MWKSIQINFLDAKKAIEEEVEEEEKLPEPEYTDAEFQKLLLFIQQIVTAYDLTEEDISESFTENVRKWLYEVMEIYVFVYFDCGILSASPAVPTGPVSQLTYFIREDPGHVFSIDGFHDEVSFGTVHENVDETLLMLFHCIYIPKILKDTRWDEKIKQKLYDDLHSFMAHLTDINSKIGSMVVLYVPDEGHNLTVEEAVLDKALIKRLENVVSYWISQIQLCLNDMKYLNPSTLPCPSDEYDFWIYKCEKFSLK